MMSNIDYTALINDEVAVEETPTVMSMRASENWRNMAGHDRYYNYTDGVLLSDDAVSEIDSNKNIKLHKSSVSITSEQYGQYIPFVLNRYQDGIDLSGAKISFNYLAPKQISPQASVAVNAQYSDTQIRFGWLVPYDAVTETGTLKFEIEAHGQFKRVDESGNITYPWYTWRTRPTEDLKITQGIGTGVVVDTADANWQTAVTTAATAAVAAVFADSKLTDTFYTKEEARREVEEIVSDSLEDYVQKDKINLVFNSATDVLTLTYGDGLTKTVDFALESVVVGVDYDEDNKSIILTLKNGSTVSVSIADIISSDLATDEEVAAAIATALTGYYTKTEINENIGVINNKFGELGTHKEEIEGEEKDVANTVVDYVGSRLGVLQRDGESKTVQEYVDSIDISARLGAIDITDEDGNVIEERTVAKFVEDKLEAYYTTNDIDTKLGAFEEGKSVKQYIDEKDISSQLTDYAKTADVESYVADKIEENNTELKTYIDNAVDNAEVDLSDYYKKSEINDKLGNFWEEGDGDESVWVPIKEYIDNRASGTSEKNYYKATYGKVEIEGQEKDNIFTLWTATEDFNPDQPGEVVPTAVSQFEIVGGGGGGGSFSKLYIYYDTLADGKLIQNYVYTEEDVAKKEAVIQYSFSGTDATGVQPITYANATWEYRLSGATSWNLIKQESISPTATGEKDVLNITEFLTDNKSYQFHLNVKDESGAKADAYWTVRRTQFRVDISLSDKKTWPIGDITFDYKAWGAGIDKIVYFNWDGNLHQVGPIKTSGGESTFTLPIADIPEIARHGSHLLEVYMTATTNGIELDTRNTTPVFRDILLFDPSRTVPVIGCAPRSYSTYKYATVNIDFAVYDPTTENPVIKIQTDGGEWVEKTVENNLYPFSFKSDVVGDHIIKVVCENGVSSIPAEKEIVVTVKDLPYIINPVEGAVIDFDPAGKNNADRVLIDEKNPSLGWKIWDNGIYTLTTSENFDWVNGGYQRETDASGALISGGEHFLIKAGTYVDLDYKFFGGEAGKGIGESNPKITGKDFKIIFKTTNIERTDAKILSCVTGAEPNKIGMEMFAHEGFIYGKTGKLHLPYSEDDVIEYGFKISQEESGTPIVMGYEDGVTTSAMVYDDTYSFVQDRNERKNVRIGSDYCDVLIYRLKIYEKALSDNQILSNFYADARSGEEMIARYERNQIYNDESLLDPETLAKKCPWLRVVTISAPHFTDGKKYPVGETTIEYRYENGKKDGSVSYWKCTNAVHIGQGTSSDLYGAAGRNLDLVLKTHKDVGNTPTLIVGEGENAKQESKVALSPTSIPVNYFNIKVNVASSENANNALLQNRYNKYNPYKRPFVDEQCIYVTNDKGVVERITPKDTMEFFNCVVFIQETDEILANHREFADTDIHFYAIGNIGDSKKTDDTRLTDPTDDYECCLEIKDVRLPLSDFPVNPIVNAMRKDEDGEYIFATQKNFEAGLLLVQSGDTYIPATTFDPETITYYINGREAEDFGGKFTYEWRYIQEYKEKHFTNDEFEGGLTAAEKADLKNKEIAQVCAAAWWNLYDFITTSSDTDFVNNFENYFVLNSALYYYLFTTRYTMVDNRAKNSFWHFGKTGTYRKVITPKKDLLPIYYEYVGGNYTRTEDEDIVSGKTYYCEHAFDLSWDYDNDTSLGIDNDGDMVYRYGLEDDDVDDLGTEIFRESDSTFFCRVRDRFAKELEKLYQDLGDAWSGENLIEQFDTWQSQFPEELWRLDIQRKYIRTYNSSFVNGKGDSKYLDNMANGKKKYQRRQFERNQEKYMASKYRSSLASGDANKIVIRTAKLTNELLAVPANYNLTLTPYTYMYLTVDYGTEVKKQRVRQLVDEEGKSISYTLEFGGTEGPDFAAVESAHWIQSMGDLSPLYPTSVSAGAAVKLKELNIGSDATKDFGDGNILTYNNPYLNTLTTGANELLEKINIENVGQTGVLTSLNTNKLENLREVYAKGSSITGFTAANGGELETVELPAVSSIKLPNLSSLNELTFDSFDNLDTIDVENCPNIDWIDIITKATNLKNFRLTGIDWHLQNTDILERIYRMARPDGLGDSQLAGKLYIDIIKTSELEKYRARWKDLEITVAPGGERKEYTVTFYNPDGTEWEELRTSVAIGDKVPEPTFIPTQEQTPQYTYEFQYWVNKANGERYNFANPVSKDLQLEAYYKEIVRTYTIIYKINQEEQEPIIANYGDYVPYTGDTPTYTAQEIANTFYLFSGWSDSGYVTEDKVIEAQFDVCIWDDSILEKPMSQLSAVEIYAISKLKNRITLADHYDASSSILLPMGETYDSYTDIIGYTFNEEQEFTGSSSSYLEVSDAKLFEKDEDFVFAIDYKMEPADGRYTDGTLCSCVGQGTGFNLSLKNGMQTLVWGGKALELATISNRREVLVIAHKKGNKNIDVYFSNAGNDIVGLTVRKEVEPGLDFVTHGSPLVFGAEKSGDGYVNNGKGTVYWARWFKGLLSENECEKLARWAHESIEMFPCFRYVEGDEQGNPDVYPIAESGDNSYSAVTFMSRYALNRPMVYTSYLAEWESSRPRTFLNEHLYVGIQNKWKQLVKHVIVKSYGAELKQTSDYIFLPAWQNMAETGYAEYQEEGYRLDNFYNNITRQTTTAEDKNTKVAYWLRSGTSGYNNYCVAVDGLPSTNYINNRHYLRFMLTI